MAVALTAELKLLEKILRPHDPNLHPAVLVPNGDDAAVLQIGDKLVVLTTDAIVEGRHFNFQYYSPQQVGQKAIESCVSDVIAMGGKPLAVLISLTLSKQSGSVLVESIYQGVQRSCRRLNCYLAGGDITTGTSGLVLGVTALGLLECEERLCLRSGAKAGDSIFVSGPLGGSAAGLDLLLKGVEGFEDLKSRHLEPRCRIDIIDEIAPYASSMIDVSDGLSSEIHHICRMSGCGAVLLDERVPVSESLKAASELLGSDPWEYVYGGGEDYELLYTMPPRFRDKALGSEIGVVTEERRILRHSAAGCVDLQLKGFDHLAE